MREEEEGCLMLDEGEGGGGRGGVPACRLFGGAQSLRTREMCSVILP